MEMPIEETLDLHTFQSREVRDLVHDYLDGCLARGLLSARIIHGKGIGPLWEIGPRGTEKVAFGGVLSMG